MAARIRAMAGTLSMALLAGLCAPARAGGDVEHGKVLYQQRCTACHSVQYNGVGPAHQGVFGRHAGRAPGYAYSPAVHDSSVTWSESSLDRWLTDPERFIPGQKMGFKVDDPAERADLIAYLKTLSAP
jgi:cytochrome c